MTKQNLKILLIEDDAAHVDLINRSFMNDGDIFSLCVAENLQKSRELISKQNFDLIIADINLPDGNALELINGENRIARLPIVFMTSQGDEISAVKAMKAGALDYVVKSYQTFQQIPEFAKRAVRSWKNIVERHRAEEALLESEEKFRTLVTHVPGAVYRLRCEPGWQAEFLSDRINDICGYQPSELLSGDQKYLGLIHDDDREIFQKTLNHAIDDHEPFLLEYRLKRKDGLIVWVRDEGQPSKNPDGNIRWIDGTIFDITSQKLAEQQLEEGKSCLEVKIRERNEQLEETHEKLLEEIEDRKRLENELLSISEDERRRVGRDLHDGVGQGIAGIVFMSKVLEQKLNFRHLPEAVDAAEIGRLLSHALNLTRTLASGLHPVDIDKNSLVPAIRDLAANCEKIFDIQCSFDCNHEVAAKSAEMAVHLYRIVQEVIINAVKFGKATKIEINLKKGDKKSTITVKSDGDSFPSHKEKINGLGRRIMDYRADLIESSLEVGRDAEGGCLVKCVFPNANN